jgi:hypothetical protein
MINATLAFLFVTACCMPVHAQQAGFTSDSTHYKTIAVAKPHVQQHLSLLKTTHTIQSEVVKPAISTETIVKMELEEAAQLRLQARHDAREYYKPRGVFWGTMGTTIIYPTAGFITGAVLSVVPPSIGTYDNPNAHLMNDAIYEKAYRKQAHRRRFGNAAAGFGAGVAVLGVITKVIVGRL